MANVVATGGHFAGVAMCHRLPQRYPWLSQRIQTFSVLEHLPKLVQALQSFQPSLLVGYPSALLLLAQEQTAGRLDIHPSVILTSGEWLDGPSQQNVGRTFQADVRDIYCASEFFYIAFGCHQGWLHLNADWLILEPVDPDFQPVPPGQASHTALLTNLANRVQPLIRYDLGDSITVQPGPCRCGNPLPAIRVAGRRDDILWFQASDGAMIQVMPLAITTMFEEIPGLERYQLIQDGPATLSIRLVVTPGFSEPQVWRTVTQNLHHYLAVQGLSFVAVRQSSKPPRRDAAGGKFRQVLIDF
jgi:phenylacetate-coenzyme A ligase PaaK-like adenylate-forming protein